MIVEVRSYRIKPGKREEFIRLFESRAISAQRSYGMKVTGPFLDVENPNKFVFLRSFPSLDERERTRDRRAAWCLSLRDAGGATEIDDQAHEQAAQRG